MTDRALTITKQRVELAELREQARAHDLLMSELLAERASLRKDLAEWQRIAQVRAERIVELEQRC